MGLAIRHVLVDKQWVKQYVTLSSITNELNYFLRVLGKQMFRLSIRDNRV